MASIRDACNLRDLRHRVTFEKQTRVADGAGGWTDSWAAERSCWAKVEPLSGRERPSAMQLEHPVTHRVRQDRGQLHRPLRQHRQLPRLPVRAGPGRDAADTGVRAAISIQPSAVSRQLRGADR